MAEEGTYPTPIEGNHHQQFTANSSQSEDVLLSHLLRTPEHESMEELLGDSASSLPQQPAGIAMQDSLGEFAGGGGLTQRSPTSAAGVTIPFSTADEREAFGFLDVNAVEVGLPQQPGRRVSCKRKKGRLPRTSAGRSEVPDFSFVESDAGRGQLDPYSHHIEIKIKPPPGSTKTAEIFRWLRQASHSNSNSNPNPNPGGNVNRTAAIYDQVRPNAVRNYVTTETMRTKHNNNSNSNWEEIDCKFVRAEEGLSISIPGVIVGVIRTLKFIREDRKVFFMREYILTDYWGIDLFFLEALYFREVFNTANDVPGVPTPPPQVNANNKTCPVKYRKRGDNNRVMGRESPIWAYFIKVYDKHPDEEGSEVVYAVCCDCHRMLKAGNGHGTTSLSRHRRESHKASTSSSQSQATNLYGFQPGDLCGVP